jgi:2-keto-3-deoxy-L-rhamnonate aldolase RhmA
MKRNPIREMLTAGIPTIGTRLTLFDATVVETIGRAGSFDYVEFGGEYAAYDLLGLENFCRAAELHGLGTMMKVDWESRGFFAQRSIGAGFDSVLFADARSAHDVAESIRLVRADTPGEDGLFGASPRRHALPNEAGSPAFVQALRDTVVAIMIEKQSAVDELDAIVQLGGIDLVQWGPNDYALSSGRPGGATSETVKEVERHVIATCLDAGIPVRAEIASAEAAEPYLELGVRHFSLFNDVSVIYDTWRRGGEQLRDIVGRG